MLKYSLTENLLTERPDDYSAQAYAMGSLDNGNLAGTTTGGSHTHTLSADGVAVMSAVAVSEGGCKTPSANTLRVDRRTVDFGGITVNTNPTAYCNGDENADYFDFVTAANKGDIAGSSNGWGYTLYAGGIDQCGGTGNSKMLCLKNSSPGTYNTVFKVTKNGCESSWSKAITIKPVPGATTLTASTTNLCQGDGATMTATTQNYISSYTYNWYRDGASTRSGSTSRTESYAAESGVQQARWRVAAVDNQCTGAMSNEVTIYNNQPTMSAAFTAQTFTTAVGFKFKITNTTKVARNSIKVYGTNKNTGVTSERSISNITDDIYTVTLTGIGSVDYNIYVTFNDDVTGACSNSYTIGTINYNSNTGYTVVSGTVQSSVPLTTPVAQVSTTVITPDYDSEAERLYREYVSGLRRDEHKAFIAPTYTTTGEAVKLLIYSPQPESATVSVTGSIGSLMSRRSVALYGGITEVRLEAHEKPQTPGMYYVVIEYANGKRETLKGVIR